MKMKSSLLAGLVATATAAQLGAPFATTVLQDAELTLNNPSGNTQVSYSHVYVAPESAQIGVKIPENIEFSYNGETKAMDVELVDLDNTRFATLGDEKFVVNMKSANLYKLVDPTRSEAVNYNMTYNRAAHGEYTHDFATTNNYFIEYEKQHGFSNIGLLSVAYPVLTFNRFVSRGGLSRWGI